MGNETFRKKTTKIIQPITTSTVKLTTTTTTTTTESTTIIKILNSKKATQTNLTQLSTSFGCNFNLTMIFLSIIAILVLILIILLVRLIKKRSVIKESYNPQEPQQKDNKSQ
jgi:carbon starvation protein CstA